MVAGKRTRAPRQPGLQSCFDDVHVNLEFEFAELTDQQKEAVKREHKFIYDPGQVPDDETCACDTDSTLARFYGHAKLASVTLGTPQKWLPDKEEFRNMTERELKQVAFVGATITLVESKRDYLQGNVLTRDFKAPNGLEFTIKQLLRAVERFEKSVREMDWEFGRLNLEHNAFEGLDDNAEELQLRPEDLRLVYGIFWGS